MSTPQLTLEVFNQRLLGGDELPSAEAVFLVVFPWVDDEAPWYETQKIKRPEEFSDPDYFEDPERTQSLDTPQALRAQLQGGSAPGGAVVDPHSLVFPILKTDRNPFAGLITLGRAANNDIHLPAPGISKVHAWFRQDESGWSLLDQGSTNGTCVNGVDLPPREFRALRSGDALRLGSVKAVFADGRGMVSLCRLGGAS